MREKPHAQFDGCMVEIGYDSGIVALIDERVRKTECKLRSVATTPPFYSRNSDTVK